MSSAKLGVVYWLRSYFFYGSSPQARAAAGSNGPFRCASRLSSEPGDLQSSRIAVAGSALIHEDNVVLIVITPSHREVGQFCGALARSAGHIKYWSPLRVCLAPRNNDNLQRQFSPSSSSAVLEHIVNPAAQLLLYAFNMARLQCHAGRRWPSCHAIGAGKRTAHSAAIGATASTVMAHFLMVRAWSNVRRTKLDVQ